MRVNKVCGAVNNPFKGDLPVQSVADEMHSLVMEAAWPGIPGEGSKAVIQRAARRLSIGYSRARCFYYRLARCVPVEEADRLRAVRRQLQHERLARLDAEMAILRLQISEAA